MNSEKAVVIYRGGLAFYRLTQKEEGLYEAVLTRYDGKQYTALPALVLLTKEGDRWLANTIEVELVRDLGRLIEQKRQAATIKTRH